MTAKTLEFSETMVSVEARCVLLKQHPLFSAWSSDLLTEFSEKMDVVHISAGCSIVTEDEVVDSIYYIVEGDAEVSQRDQSDANKHVILETLHAGESIGLSETGLYSATGLRTATVTALIPCVLVRVRYQDFRTFLQKHPELNSNLLASIEGIHKMQLIKQSAPFAKLSPTQIKWLVTRIEERTVAEHTTLIQQGDKGDYCYLLSKGQVEISHQDDDGTKRMLALLSAPAVFGEMAILMDMPRTATIITVSECELMQLHRDDLKSLLATEHLTSKSFSTLTLERGRPKRIACIIEHLQSTKDEQRTIILKNPQLNQYYQLSNEGGFIWNMMDGKHTIKEIILAFDAEFGVFSNEMVSSLILDLAYSGFVELRHYHPVHSGHLPLWMRFMENVRSVMEADWQFPRVDQFLTKSFQARVKYFFTWPVQLLFMLIAISGTILFGFFSHKAELLLPKTQHLLLLFVFVYFINVLLIVVHELAHAYTTKYYGRDVHTFGIGWYWLGPIAFTETSDMWLATKWPRIIVNSAGVYVDFVMAGLFSLFAWFVSSPSLAIFFWLSSIVLYIGIFRNLYPLVEYDGYYILMDLFDRPHLREDALTWLIDAVKSFPNSLSKEFFAKDYWPEIGYWLICVVFMILAPLMAWYLQHFILSHIFPVLSYNYLRYLFPLIAVILSFLSLWVEMYKANQLLEI